MAEQDPIEKALTDALAATQGLEYAPALEVLLEKAQRQANTYRALSQVAPDVGMLASAAVMEGMATGLRIAATLHAERETE